MIAFHGYTCNQIPDAIQRQANADKRTESEYPLGSHIKGVLLQGSVQDTDHVN